MCKEYDENRKKLSELIFQKKEFTESELIQEFKKERDGKIEIGRLQTIHNYLDDLQEFGVLKWEDGRYHTQDWPSVLA
jgi:hypothetical protein